MTLVRSVASRVSGDSALIVCCHNSLGDSNEQPALRSLVSVVGVVGGCLTSVSDFLLGGKWVISSW